MLHMACDFYYISFTAGIRSQELHETVTSENDGFLFHVFLCLSYLSKDERDIFTPFATHTMTVTPLGNAGLISCLGEHMVGDGQTSHFPPLPVPEP